MTKALRGRAVIVRAGDASSSMAKSKVATLAMWDSTWALVPLGNRRRIAYLSDNITILKLLMLKAVVPVDVSLLRRRIEIPSKTFLPADPLATALAI